MLKVASIVDVAGRGARVPFDLIVLEHDERQLRRRVLTLQHGDKVLADFPEPVFLKDRDCLVLDDGRLAEVIAADEPVLVIEGRDAVHLTELAWHIGNRHLAAEITAEAIVILADHVIAAMLEGLGARVSTERQPFHPMRGAYSGHGHGGHGH